MLADQSSRPGTSNGGRPTPSVRPPTSSALDRLVVSSAAGTAGQLGGSREKVVEKPVTAAQPKHGRPASRANSVASSTIPIGLPSSRGFQTEYRRRFTPTLPSTSSRDRPSNIAPQQPVSAPTLTTGGLWPDRKITRTLPYRPGTAQHPKVPSTPVVPRTTPQKNDESPGWASGMARPSTALSAPGTPLSERPRTQTTGSARPAQTPDPLPPPSASRHRPPTTKPNTLSSTSISSPGQSAGGTPSAHPLALTPTGFRLTSYAASSPSSPAHPSPPKPPRLVTPLSNGGQVPFSAATCEKAERVASIPALPPAIQQPKETVNSNSENMANDGDGLGAVESPRAVLEHTCHSRGMSWERERTPPRKPAPNIFEKHLSCSSTPRLPVPAIDLSVPATPDKQQTPLNRSSEAAEVDILRYRAPTNEADEGEEACSVGQAAPMVLNLEDLAQCTPEVLELEVGNLDLAQLEQLEHKLRGDLEAR